MGLRADQSQRLVALFALGVLLLTYPLLDVFNHSGFVFGIPVLYAYLFGAWGGLIAMLALAARQAPPEGGPHAVHGDGAAGPAAVESPAAPDTTARPAAREPGARRDQRP